MARIDGLDGYVNIQEKNINLFVEAIYFYAKANLDDVAASKGWSQGAMFESLIQAQKSGGNEYKRSYIFSIPTTKAVTRNGRESSPAACTYAVTMGLMDNFTGKITLTPIGHLLYEHLLSAQTYTLNILSKVGLYINGLRQTNLLTAFCKYAVSNKNASYNQTSFANVFKYGKAETEIYDVDARADISFNALVLCGLLSLANDGNYYVAEEDIPLVEYIATNGDLISAPKEGEATYMGNPEKGVIEIAATSGMHLFNHKYPDIKVLRLPTRSISNYVQTPASADQTIYYGCPGTGKSHKVKGLTEGNDGEKIIYFDQSGRLIEDISTIADRTKVTTNIFRTTFHPDYDYSSFVGSYKPIMVQAVDENGNETGKEDLTYDFVPQVFTNAYVRAWKSLTDESLTASEKQVYLIIEEINRGNCAQIFGDLFQLLDRKNGYSEYPIIPDAELRKYLAKQGLENNSLKLPCNLHILATMNTSDQSLFPMDSAFKRRWAMEYVPINLDGKDSDAKDYTFTVKGVAYSWLDFLKKVNPLIRKATDSEDKQMGEFFIKGKISEDDFKNKVMFYIWNDICKDLYSASRISPLYFMRNTDGDDKKDVFTFAELFGKGRYNEEDKAYTSPSDLLEGFITKRLFIQPQTPSRRD